jgi:hypothetical protein
MDDRERLWTVEYSRGGQTLGIEVDLMEWDLKRRWTEDGDQDWPMVESRLGRQNANGKVTVGDAIFTCGTSPAWLYAAPQAKVWVAGYIGNPAPVSLTVPGGSVKIEAMGTGTVVWDNGKVSIDALDVIGTPAVAGESLLRE